MPLVLPHELLNALHTSGRPCDLCDAESLTAFWDNFKGHESSQVQWPRLGTWGMIPMGVHGDDFRYLENGGKIIAFSMNILTDDNQERFPLFAIRVVAGSLLGCCVLLFFLNYVEASLNPSILNLRLQSRAGLKPKPLNHRFNYQYYTETIRHKAYK